MLCSVGDEGVAKGKFMMESQMERMLKRETSSSGDEAFTDPEILISWLTGDNS